MLCIRFPQEPELITIFIDHVYPQCAESSNQDQCPTVLSAIQIHKKSLSLFFRAFFFKPQGANCGGKIMQDRDI